MRTRRSIGSRTIDETAATRRLCAYRWTICALLFAATAVNYVDRQMIGVLKPLLQSEFGWRESSYADIVFWFQAAYAIGFVFVGRFMDVVGVRIGYAVAFGFWTLAHMAHGLARSVAGFDAARFALGLGEAGNFPAGLKTVSEWFEQRERALAVGIFNAGANVGAIVTPILVPALTLSFGWRMAFVITGVFGVLWVAVWLLVYRSPGNDRAAASAPQPGAASWRSLFGYRETWAYAVPKFLTDPIFWMFLFWLPDFLGRRYGLDLKSFGLPLVAIYLMSDVGSVVGGFVSSRLIKRGLPVNRARKLTMLGCAIAVLPILAVQYVDDLWIAVLLIGLATAAHQAWSANLLTLPTDLFPQTAIGSVVGIGGMAGAIGGMLIAKFVGYVLDASGSYAPIFAVAAGAYLVALVALQLLSPRLRPAPIHGAAPIGDVA